MNRLRRCNAAISLFCALVSAAPAEAQFETRSTTQVGFEPCSVVAGDFNKDGKQDLAVALGNYQVEVLLGKGNGTFQSPVAYDAGTAPSWVTAATLTSSHNLDLVVANRLSPFISVFLGNGDGTFQAAHSIDTPYNAGFVAVGDFNGDHVPDILVVDNPDVQFTNTGAIAVRLTNMDLRGSNPYDFSETSNCPSSLGAGASCTITVTFTPIRTGARSAILYIADTGGGSPQSVALFGTGT